MDYILYTIHYITYAYQTSLTHQLHIREILQAQISNTNSIRNELNIYKAPTLGKFASRFCTSYWINYTAGKKYKQQFIASI